MDKLEEEYMRRMRKASLQTSNRVPNHWDEEDYKEFAEHFKNAFDLKKHPIRAVIMNEAISQQLEQMQSDLLLQIQSAPKKDVIQRLPGEASYNFVSRFCNAKARETIIDPTRADDTASYIEAVARNDAMAQRWFGVLLVINPFRVLIQAKIEKICHLLIDREYANIAISKPPDDPSEF
jgi:hypothetical protein